MENIFYAALALHVAGKPINRTNIKAVLEAAGRPVNETALDAMAALVEALETARQKKERPIDPRIVRLLTSELTQQKVQINNLEAAFMELEKSITSAPKEHEGTSTDKQTQGALWAKPENLAQEEPTCDHAEVSMEVPVWETGALAQAEGIYVYGVAASGNEVGLGSIGIERSAVYTVSYKNLCAIVHNCTAEPYQSNDEETVKSWVRAHQAVLDKGKEQFGPVIPLGFDTILQPKDSATSLDQVVRDWLREDYDRLCTVMEKIQGKDEYVVQVSYEPGAIGRRISEQSGEIQRIQDEIATKPPGMAYVYRQRLEKVVKAEMEKLADEWFKDFYGRIKKHTDDIVVEKTKKLGKDKVMLLNLSCLVSSAKVHDLGDELGKIDSMEGFSAHFSGPWPPYSFVAKLVVPTEERRNGAHAR
jgi:hypothetical protein